MDIFEKIRNGDYYTTIPYPERPRKPTLAPGATAAQAREYADKLEEYEVYTDTYLRLVKEYGEENSRLEQKFINDLEEVHEVGGNPKAKLLYSIASEHGHSYGFSEVASHYSRMVELIS